MIQRNPMLLFSTRTTLHSHRSITFSSTVPINLIELNCSPLKSFHVHSIAHINGSLFVDSDAIHINSTNWLFMDLINVTSSSVDRTQSTAFPTCLLDHVMIFNCKLVLFLYIQPLHQHVTSPTDTTISFCYLTVLHPLISIL